MPVSESPLIEKNRFKKFYHPAKKRRGKTGKKIQVLLQVLTCFDQTLKQLVIFL